MGRSLRWPARDKLQPKSGKLIIVLLLTNILAELPLKLPRVVRWRAVGMKEPRVTRADISRADNLRADIWGRKAEVGGISSGLWGAAPASVAA